MKQLEKVPFCNIVSLKPQQTQFYVSFIALCSQNGSFWTPESCQF